MGDSAAATAGTSATIPTLDEDFEPQTFVELDVPTS